MLSTFGWFLVGIPVVLLVYAYAAYPATLSILAARRGATKSRSARRIAERDLPLVSVVVPAYNEEAQIRGAIEALLAQDYPANRLQILIVSDASTDRTDEIVTEYAERGVQLLRMPTRGGKTAAENATSQRLRGDIIVNSDSSVRLHSAAVRLLVEAMEDPNVGVASTRDISVTPGQGGANAAEAGYVGYEMRIRSLETRTGGIVGASGSGYAIRAQLHRLPVRPDLSRDFSAALTARRHGFTAVSVDDALCFVPRTTSLRSEYKRKVRTIARGIDTLVYQRQLLDPMRYGAFAWKLLSHKICRWLVPPSAISGAIGLALLSPIHPWAAAGLALAFGIAGCAAVGALWPSSRPTPRPLSIVTFAVAANLAVVHALWRVAFGHQDHLWEPTRRVPAAAVK